MTSVDDAFFSTQALFREIQSQFDLSWQQGGRWEERVARSSLLETCLQLPGDASTRRYYRVQSGSQGSFILMKMESFADQGNDLPFLAVQHYLQAIQIPVPKVFQVDPERGLILLEDLGDETLLRSLKKVTEGTQELLYYQQAVDLLCLFQENFFRSIDAQQPLLGSLAGFHLAFDFEKLFWEVNHTIEHLFHFYLKRSITSTQHSFLKKGFEQVCDFLSKRPRVLAHRDYHSRNIMRVLPRWVMIDFQDARMGPFSYDLVSLLKDSYYVLPERHVTSLVQFYWERMSTRYPDSFDLFCKEFDWMILQRNFKAIGSFASFYQRRQDASYLKFIGNTFHNIYQVLMKYPDLRQLREVLFELYSF